MTNFCTLVRMRTRLSAAIKEQLLRDAPVEQVEDTVRTLFYLELQDTIIPVKSGIDIINTLSKSAASLLKEIATPIQDDHK